MDNLELCSSSVKFNKQMYQKKSQNFHFGFVPKMQKKKAKHLILEFNSQLTDRPFHKDKHYFWACLRPDVSSLQRSPGLVNQWQ